MNRQLRKLISFTAAAAVMANSLLLSTDAAYVGERLSENDFDSLATMQDKDILIDNGTVESVENGDQLVVIDKDGNKKLISLEEGITGLYTYSSTTLEQYNYLAPTPMSYSFDFFDPNYQLSTEQGAFIAGIGEKFALMDNDGNIVSEKYDLICWITDGYYLAANRSGDDFAMGIIDVNGSEIIAVLDENKDFLVSADRKYFIVKSDAGSYFADMTGKKVSPMYDEIAGIYTSHYGDHSWEEYDHNSDFDDPEKKYESIVAKSRRLSGNCYRITNSDGTYLLLDSSLKEISKPCSSVSFYGKDKFRLYGCNEEGDYGYTLIDDTGKVYYENISYSNSIYDGSTDSYLYVIRKGDEYCILDNEYNPVMNASSYSQMYFNGQYYLVIDDTLYNSHLDILKEDFDYSLRSYGSTYTIWEKDGEYFTMDMDTYEMHSFEIPRKEPNSELYVTGFNSSSWSNSLEVCTSETYIIENDDDPEETSEYTEYYTWRFKANDGGRLINTDSYYSVDFSASDDIAIVRETEESPFTAIKMDGTIITELPEDFKNYYLDVEVGGERVWNERYEEYEENVIGRYNIFSDEDCSFFSVYDENMELIDENVEGKYKGKNIIMSAVPDEDGEYKKGMYIPGQGMIYKPIYDDINFTNDVVIITANGKTMICDYDKKVIQELEGAYEYKGGTDSAYRTRLTLNCHGENSTKSVVFNSESGAIEYSQDGLYDNVDQFEGDYAQVTVYGEADPEDLWSENDARKGVIRIDGTELVRPSVDTYLSIRPDGYTKSVEDPESGDTVSEHVEGEYIIINGSIESIESFMPEFAADNDLSAAIKLSDESVKAYKDGFWGIYSADGTVLYDTTCEELTNYGGVLYAEKKIYYEEPYERYDPDLDLYVTDTRTAYRYSHGIIDMNGKVIADPLFDGNDEFSKMNCNVSYSTDEHFSIAYLLKNEADRIRAFDFFAKDRFNDMTKNYGYDFAFEAGDLYIVQKDDLQGVADSANNIIIPVEYKEILSFSKYSVVGKNDDLKQQLADTKSDKLRRLTDGSYLLYARTQDNRIRPFIIRYTEDIEPDPKVTTTAVTTAVVQTTTTTTAADVTETDTATTSQSEGAVTTTTAPVFDVPEYDRTDAEFGDYNCDGTIDSCDASEILVLYAIIQTGGADAVSAEDIEAGDFDDDGMLTSADASIVLMYYSYTSTGGTMKFKAFLEADIE